MACRRAPLSVGFMVDTDDNLTRSLPVERYQTAEQLLEHNWKALVIDPVVKPQWLDDGARFLFRTDRRDGPAFLVVDPSAGTREPAFDHDRLAEGLGRATGTNVAPDALPFTHVEMTGEAVTFSALDRRFECRLDDYTVREVDAPAGQDPMAAHSPDGRWAVTLRDHDLWITDTRNGAERRLTTMAPLPTATRCSPTTSRTAC